MSVLIFQSPHIKELFEEAEQIPNIKHLAIIAIDHDDNVYTKHNVANVVEAIGMLDIVKHHMLTNLWEEE